MISSFNYPSKCIFPLAILPRESYGSPKLLRQAKIQKNFCSPSRLGYLTLKPATFEDVYQPLVANEASRGHILNTNQLHNNLQSLNINRPLFIVKKNLIYTKQTLNYHLS